MSTTTPNLGLVLYDTTTDQAVSFSTFRAVWGGTSTSSNFYKIDTAIGTINSQIATLQATKGAIPVNATFISPNYYEATVAQITAYTTGMTIVVSVNQTSDGTVTLQINSLGIKSLMKVNSTGTAVNLTGSDLVVGRKYLFVYDGSKWLWVSANSADQIQIVGTVGNVVTVGSTNELLGTLTQSLLISQTINSATGKSTPVGADKLGIVDTEAANVLKSLSLTDLLTYANKQNNAFYSLSTSIISSNLSVALKHLDGSDPTSARPINILIGNSYVSVTGALSVTVTAASGDVFDFDAGKIQDNDCQLFVYLVNNNGTPQLAVSPNPTHQTVASPYYDAGGQTGAASQNNMVMSGTRNVTNSCAVIGRITANQTDANNWQNPILNNVVNYPIYETTWLTWNPFITGFSVEPASPVFRYMVRYKTNFYMVYMANNGTSNATNFVITSPFKHTQTTFASAPFPIDNGTAVQSGFVNTVATTRNITLGKSAGATWTASGGKRSSFEMFVEVF